MFRRLPNYAMLKSMLLIKLNIEQGKVFVATIFASHSFFPFFIF